MGQVDLNFKPSVPVFDANMALGRRHDRRVRVDTVEGALESMGRAGVSRALVYSPHAANFDSGDGNDLLMEMVQSEPSLVPQFVCTPTFDDLDLFGAQVMELGIRSVRMFPTLHRYPFQDWVVKPWLDWLTAEQLPLWLAAEEIDPSSVHDTLAAYPELAVVLCEVHYSHLTWVLPMLRSLPNLRVEISRMVATDGIATLIDAVGDERVLYGSRFPDHPLAPNLYYLHRCGLSDEALRAICSSNLQRLLKME